MYGLGDQNLSVSSSKKDQNGLVYSFCSLKKMSLGNKNETLTKV